MKEDTKRPLRTLEECETVQTTVGPLLHHSQLCGSHSLENSLYILAMKEILKSAGRSFFGLMRPRLSFMSFIPNAHTSS